MVAVLLTPTTARAFHEFSVTASTALLAAARGAGLPDVEAPLRWLAWRHEQLENYEPGMEEPTPRLDGTCEALVVFGSAMAAVPVSAADLFVDVLYPAGCRSVVLSGGVGRGTLALFRELVERDLPTFDATWEAGSQPKQINLPTQGVSKPVLATDDPWPEGLDERRCFCSEADIMLELCAPDSCDRLDRQPVRYRVIYCASLCQVCGAVCSPRSEGAFWW